MAPEILMKLGGKGVEMGMGVSKIKELKTRGGKAWLPIINEESEVTKHA